MQTLRAISRVQPLIEPSLEMMQRHLEHLFGGFLDGCHDGLIEIAHTDTHDRKLKHVRLFGTDEIEEAAQFAFEQNRLPGQNVYVGAALRKPEAPRDRRASDDDVLCLPAFYTDLDQDEAAKLAKQRYRGCPPTCVVVTGRKPHVRAQLWWLQEAPERDPTRIRQQNAALAAALGGDSTVVNPSRVMRIAGSIAWPHKPGRVLERTELQSFTDGRPRSYAEGQLAKAFPAVEEKPPTSPSKPAPTLNIGTPDPLSVEAALQAVKSGHQWHNNLLRLVAHWVARNWSDAEIIAATESLTLPGYRADQTRREVSQMILGARAKGAIPDPANKLDEIASAPLLISFIHDLNIAMLPQRRWMLGRCLLCGHLSLLVAPPGVGKSTLCIALGVAVVTGKNITGHSVHQSGKVWIYNNEDDEDELKRRLAAVLQHHGLTLDDIKDRLAINSGSDRPLLFAKTQTNGGVLRLPDVEACIAHIKANDIKVFIADPFVETHEVEENSNEQIKVVAQMFREIARRTGCAVLLVHHTAKPPQGSSDGHAGNMHTARGASALVGVARVVVTLFGMSNRDAERYSVRDEDRHLYARLDDAKANLSLASPNALWFRRASVTIANGDEVGVLETVELASAPKPDSHEEDERKTVIACLLAQIQEPEISLNAAAKQLAWSGDERFAQYRQTDDKGNRRASRTLREIIVTACRMNTVIVNDGMVSGFTANMAKKPVTLKRFSRAFGTPELAASAPELWPETEDIPIIRLGDLSSAQIRAYRLADNQLALNADWDEKMLAAELARLQEEDFDLALTGFPTDELDRLLAETGQGGNENAGEDSAPEPPVTPVSQTGDLWLLGRHRLQCGDSTSAEDINRLMDGKKAKLFSTDPPYLVDYTGANRPGCFETRDWSDLYREIDIKDAEGFLRGLFSVGMQVCEENSAWYCWHAHKRASLIEKIWHELGVLNHQQIIWVKPVFVQSFSFYPWQHEPCLMGWKQVFKPEHDGDNSSVTSVWQLDWEGRARPFGAEHPTMKPIEIFAIPMRKHTKPGDICYEPFSGSGSQIMAGEKTGRCVYANEIQPAFVDVAIRRWQEAAGEDAVLVATGQSYTKTAAARGVDPQAAA